MLIIFFGKSQAKDTSRASAPESKKRKQTATPPSSGTKKSATTKKGKPSVTFSSDSPEVSSPKEAKKPKAPRVRAKVDFGSRRPSPARLSYRLQATPDKEEAEAIHRASGDL